METATCEWKTLRSSVTICRAEATRFWFMYGRRLEEWVEAESRLLAKRSQDDLMRDLWGGPTIQTTWPENQPVGPHYLTTDTY